MACLACHVTFWRVQSRVFARFFIYVLAGDSCYLGRVSGSKTASSSGLPGSGEGNQRVGSEASSRVGLASREHSGVLRSECGHDGFPIVRGWIHCKTSESSEGLSSSSVPPEVQEVLAKVWPDYLPQGIVSGSKVPVKEEICQEVLDESLDEGAIVEVDEVAEEEEVSE